MTFSCCIELASGFRKKSLLNDGTYGSLVKLLLEISKKFDKNLENEKAMKTLSEVLSQANHENTSN